MHKELAAMVVA